MRATKYIHACLLLEEGGEKLLFDPGKFTFIEGLVTPETFRHVNRIVVTHGHPDHLEPDMVKRIVELSGAMVIGNSEVAETLRAEAIAVTVLEDGEKSFGKFKLRAVPAKHQPILAPKLPKNTAYVVNGELLNSGDSFDARMEEFAGIKTLALPVMAPYLTELQVQDFAKRMRPKQAVPLHDGYAKDWFIKQRYDNYESEFGKLGVKLHRLEKPGDSAEL